MLTEDTRKKLIESSDSWKLLARVLLVLTVIGSVLMWREFGAMIAVSAFIGVFIAIVPTMAIAAFMGHIGRDAG